MALNEACQLWMEQRIEEELEIQPDTEKSLRAIGREIAKEIEKLFEVRIEPTTIAMKASRQKAVTNVTPDEEPPVTPQPDSEIPKQSSLEKSLHGGKLEGAGRPKTPPLPLREIEPRLMTTRA